VATALLVIVLVGPFLGREIFPQVSSGQLLLRFRPHRQPCGKRPKGCLSTCSALSKKPLGGECDDHAGVTSAHRRRLPINTIYLWTSGQHEAVLRVALNPASNIRVDEFENQLRKRFRHNFQAASFLRAADIVTQIMNFGAPTQWKST